MSCRPKGCHGLARNRFNEITTTQPIGLIASWDVDGTEDTAPHLLFNALARDPPQVKSASTGVKSSQEDAKLGFCNIRQTGTFCVNVVECATRGWMNAN